MTDAVLHDDTERQVWKTAICSGSSSPGSHWWCSSPGSSWWC